MQVQGVVVREAGKPGEVEEIVLQDPGPGQVRVRIEASGVCRFCRIGLLHLCPDNQTAAGAIRTSDGKVLTPVGGVGTFCTHTVVAAAHAERIIAIDVAPEKLARAEQFGATDVIDARDGNVVERIRALTDGAPPSPRGGRS